LFAATALSASVGDAEALALTRPQEQIVPKGIEPSRLAALLKPVDAFYGFWVNGSTTLLSGAIGADFVDHTLPPGRLQGPTGPAQASRTFLAAVPDLRLTVVQRFVVGDRVISHLHFTGRFTGTFMGHAGAGQPVDFIASTSCVSATGGSQITGIWKTISPFSSRSARQWSVDLRRYDTALKNYQSVIAVKRVDPGLPVKCRQRGETKL